MADVKVTMPTNTSTTSATTESGLPTCAGLVEIRERLSQFYTETEIDNMLGDLSLESANNLITEVFG